MTTTDERRPQLGCICTSIELDTGRPFRGCTAHERPDTAGETCGHTDREGCTGHGDF